MTTARLTGMQLLFPGGSGQAAGEDAHDERAQKRARRPKDYFPSVGSANYAFLITLLRVRRSRTPRALPAEAGACMQSLWQPGRWAGSLQL